ncbi:MAG: hypothetical protein LBR26_14170 [Prevotella sp.]|jgi:hypothetical protein|nr:hypothetical protein [Prevotella sp.]
MRFLPYACHAQNHAVHDIAKGAKNQQRKFNRPSGLRGEEVVLLKKLGGNEVFTIFLPCTKPCRARYNINSMGFPVAKLQHKIYV